MNTPNMKMIVPNALGPDDEDQDLRALITVELDEEDGPPFQSADEFSDEFPVRAPTPPA